MALRRWAGHVSKAPTGAPGALGADGSAPPAGGVASSAARTTSVLPQVSPVLVEVTSVDGAALCAHPPGTFFAHSQTSSDAHLYLTHQLLFGGRAAPGCVPGAANMDFGELTGKQPAGEVRGGLWRSRRWECRRSWAAHGSCFSEGWCACFQECLCEQSVGTWPPERDSG